MSKLQLSIAIGDYDRNRPFATWLLSIAAHYCIDRLRRRKLSMFSLDEENDDGVTFEIADPASPNPEAESVKREERDRLSRPARFDIKCDLIRWPIKEVVGRRRVLHGVSR